MKLIWSKRSLSDLIRIGEFISRNAPENARRQTQKIVFRAKQAAKHSASGRIVSEYQDENLRELIEGNFRIIYEVNSPNRRVVIITIFEGHRLIAKDLR